MEINWEDSANCKGTDTEAFFTDEGKGANYDVKLLTAICSRCTVRKECLQIALDNEWIKGWWGGTNERTRERLRQKIAS